MSGFLSDDILKAWHRFLQEVELARNYHMPYLLDAVSGTFRNPLLDYLLPSLLYIKMIAILDEALAVFIDHRGFTVPKTLHGRIEFLNDRRMIANYSALHDIRGRRNRLAHDISVTIPWNRLHADLDTIENEMQHLNLVGDRPDYEYFGERSGVRECDDPGVAFAQDYRFGIKCNDRVTMEVSFTRKWCNSDE